MTNRMKKWYNKKVAKPLGATIDGWEDWTELVSKKHPVLYFLFETFPGKIRRFIKFFPDTKYHLKQKYTRKGFHLLELDVKRFKQPYNKERLGKYSWMDTDSQLELFSFQMLVNYIEKEKDYEKIKEYLKTGDVEWDDMEAAELYDWFINEYCDDTAYNLDKWELYSRYPNHKNYQISLFKKEKSDDEREFNRERRGLYAINQERENELNEQMTENLQRLASIRKSLWT